MMDQKTSFYSVANETSPLIYPSFYPPLRILSTPIILSSTSFAARPGQPIYNLTNTFTILCRVTQNTSNQYLHFKCTQTKYYHTQHNSSSKHSMSNIPRSIPFVFSKALDLLQKFQILHTLQSDILKIVFSIAPEQSDRSDSISYRIQTSRSYIDGTNFSPEHRSLCENFTISHTNVE